MLILDLALFGVYGHRVWAVQMLWIPILAAGVINGVGHYFGYRNFEPPDASTNIVPWGILIGGEELHNNHHAFPSSARLSSKWWEFDIGWMYIRILQGLGLAKVRTGRSEPAGGPGQGAIGSRYLARRDHEPHACLCTLREGGYGSGLTRRALP
jgi:stearoyl-CoA desaturase (Delta-9 desaturase)